MNIGSLVSLLITVFLLLGCGFFCRKVGIIDDLGSKRLSKLIIAVGQPLLIVGTLNKAEYSEENLTIAWTSMLLGFAVHIVLALLALLICHWFKNLNRAKLFEFGLVFANLGFLGFPVLDSIFGNGMGSFMGCFFFISFHILIWTWGIVILARGRSDIRLTPKKAFVNYGTVPCLVGIILYLLKPVFTLPEPVGNFFNYLGGLCTPISLLVTGGLLATISLKKMLTDRGLYLHSFLKLIAFPIVVCILAKLCGLSDTYVLLCTVMAGLPSASSVSMLAELYDIEPGFASQTVGMSSVLTVASLPLVVWFAQWFIELF